MAFVAQIASISPLIRALGGLVVAHPLACVVLVDHKARCGLDDFRHNIGRSGGPHLTFLPFNILQGFDRGVLQRHYGNSSCYRT